MKRCPRDLIGVFLFLSIFVTLFCASRARAAWPFRPGLVTEISSMHIARASQTATLLPNGKVLIAGGFSGSGGESNPYRSTEFYDPSTGQFEAGPEMTIGRSGHTATLLENGKVLIVGGWTGHYGVRRSAELYDPATKTFTPTGNLIVERAGSTATLLRDGRVLVAGGEGRREEALNTAELYDPATGKFCMTGSMAFPRDAHTATLLADGKVLIVGGGSGHYPSQTIYREAELFDPATAKFSLTSQSVVPRHKHAAILLHSGKVLIVGGSDSRDWRGEYSSAELYDPATGSFTATGSMHGPRFKLPAAATLLPNGRVLVAGGGAYAELYDESRGMFIQVPGSLGAARYFASVTLLPEGSVLIAGGYAQAGSGLPASAGAWLYRGSEPHAAN
ncbi:MAG TPA: kelch repeat-containing protein [Candidatus Acidoferrum sp.]|nr:kelch repeat-containing protein [Candidatus Acidoferrum sp.]